MQVDTDTIFEYFFAQMLEQKRHRFHRIDAMITFTIIEEKNKSWTFDLRKERNGKILKGIPPQKSDLNFYLKDTFLPYFITGDYNPLDAFHMGYLNIVGNHEVLKIFVSLFDIPKSISFSKILKPL